LTETTDPRNWAWVTRYTYNVNNQLVSTQRADGNANLRNYYDQLGRQIGARDANGNTSLQSFDAAGNLVLETRADGGMVHYQYDSYGQRIRTMQANGVLTDYAYDRLGNVIRTTQAAAVGVEVYASSGAGTGAATVSSQLIFTYNRLGLLTQIDDKFTGQVTQYDYDLAGNRSLERTTKLVAGPTGYSYQALQDNRLVYDSLGRLTDVSNAAGGTYTLHYDYDANGNRTHVVTGFVENGELKYVKHWNKYDAMNRQVIADGVELAPGVIGITTGKGQRLAYDNAGSRTMMQQGGKKLRATTEEVPGPFITYGELGPEYGPSTTQLKWVAEDAIVNEAYSYDIAGRLTDVYRDGMDIEARRYDAAGRVVRQGLGMQADAAQLAQIAALLRESGIGTDIRIKLGDRSV
jgi:YD repeat-containing protein